MQHGGPGLLTQRDEGQALEVGTLYEGAQTRYIATKFGRMMELTEELDTDPIDEVSRTNCFAGETKVITRDGTRPLRDLAGGVHELLTENGRWVKAPVASFGEQPLLKLTLTRCGVQKVIYATPEHDWILRSRSDEHCECSTAALGC